MRNTDESLHDNKKNNPKENHPDNFDREYGLSELLSISVLDDLCGEIQKIVPVPIAVFMKKRISISC